MCGVSGLIHYKPLLLEKQHALQSYPTGPVIQEDIQAQTGLEYANQSAAIDIYHSLLSLQHRGQDAAGIMSYSFFHRRFYWEKKLGLVNQAIHKDKLPGLLGEMAIGHTRYATVGGQNLNDLQPMVSGYPYGISMVHNGNLVNYAELRNEFAPKMNIQLLTQNDLEFILQGLCYYLHKNSQTDKNEFSQENLVYAFRSLVEVIKGGYSLVGMIANQGMFAFRDPKGIRPLVWGKKRHEDGSESILFASETTALNFLGHESLGELKPGELIFVNKSGEVFRYNIQESLVSNPCMFETVYFSGAESESEGKTVYQKRLQLGQQLAEEIIQQRPHIREEIDVIMPVPDTSRTASIALAETLKVPYREGLIKNRYIYRSFILPSQLERSSAVRHKLIPVQSEIQGKNILLVDDSLVRGTTSRRIIELLKQYGANKIYLALTCPPIKYACYFGIDFPDEHELMANNRQIEEMAAEVGADRLYFLSIDGLLSALDNRHVCKGCLDGNYPVSIQAAAKFSRLRADQKEKESKEKLL